LPPSNGSAALPDLSEDINVDELRRRARRRLVGAVVLALAAAVIVPMLLESEPRPLGEDVTVKIPPVDDGKFVNRLNDPAKADKAAANRPSDAKDAKPARDATAPDAGKVTEAARPRYDTRLAEQNAPAGTQGTPASDNKGAPSTDSKVAQAGDSKGAPAGDSKVAPAGDSKAAPASDNKGTAPSAVTFKAAPAPPPKAAAAPVSPPANGAFAVQLAAFSDDKGANALAARLKRSGYTAYTEPYKTSKGTLWRVRVGPYSSRETAMAARDKLKAEGQNGIVAAARE
jgi:DedD protein